MEPQKLISDLLKRGLSETQIAALCGISQPTVNRIRNGRIRSPSYHLVRKLEALRERLV